MFEAIKNYFKYELKPAITNIPWKKIPASTYVGWVMAILLSVNSILMLFGVSPINYNEDSVAKVVTLIVNVLVLIANTYNNNSTSSEAVFGDKIVTALKLADESDKKDAIDKLNVILHELNNSGAYATIVTPDESDDGSTGDNPEMVDEITPCDETEEKTNESDTTEHTNDDESNGFIDIANVTFVNVDDEELSVSDLPASDQTNETEK